MSETPKKGETSYATTPNSPTELVFDKLTPVNTPMTTKEVLQQIPYSASMEHGNTVIAIRKPFDSVRRIIYNKAGVPATTGYIQNNENKNEDYYDDPDPKKSIYIYDYTGEIKTGEIKTGEIKTGEIKDRGPAFLKKRLFSESGPGGKRRSKRRRSKRTRSKSKKRRRLH